MPRAGGVRGARRSVWLWCHGFGYAELRKVKTKPLGCVQCWEVALRVKLPPGFVMATN